MRKLLPVLLVLSVWLTSCQLLEKFQSEGTVPPADAVPADASEEANPTAQPTPEKTDASKEANPTAQPTPEKTDAQTQKTEADPDIATDTAAPEVPADARIIVIQRTHDAPFVTDGRMKATKHVKLKIKRKKTSEWLNTDKWFVDNLFDKPSLNRTENGYTFEGQAKGMAYDYQYNILKLTSPNGVTTDYDFSSFGKPEASLSYELAFIHYAVIQNDTLYVSLAHRTYSREQPDTAFLLALDLEGNVLWQSQTLVCNAMNFLIMEDTIVCGYGFTDEPDFIYTLDKNTGSVVDKIPIRSGPHYFVLTDNVIRLATYNTDYTLSYQ